MKTKNALFTFDATGGKAIGTHVIGRLPSGARIVNAWYEVLTTFTTASSDAGTIALTTGKDAGDLVAALAVSNAANIWDAGIKSTKVPYGAALSAAADSTYAADPEGNAINYAMKAFERGTPNYITLTADSDVAVVIAGQDVTAGKLVLHVEYVK